MTIGRISIRILLAAFVCALIYGALRIPEIIDSLFPSKQINVLVWPNIIDEEHFAPFEKETGIKVRLSYFEHYEELLVKMQSGMGDYDLVMASDYAVRALIASDMLKPVDRSKLPFWDELYPVLLSKSFDPENRYTIPYSWEFYGIGVDKRFYKGKVPPATWGLLFDEKISPARVGMLDDGRELISIVYLYLFGGKKQKISVEQMHQIGALLQQQKKRVVMYTDMRTDYLLVSESAPVVLGLSSDMYHAMYHDENISFLLPKEGSFMLIDLWIIPKETQKDEWVYQFLSYMYRPEVMKKYVDRYKFFPAMHGVPFGGALPFVSPTKSLVSRLRLFEYDIPDKQMRELWISLKS